MNEKELELEILKEQNKAMEFELEKAKSAVRRRIAYLVTGTAVAIILYGTIALQDITAAMMGLEAFGIIMGFYFGERAVEKLSKRLNGGK